MPGVSEEGGPVAGVEGTGMWLIGDKLSEISKRQMA